MGSCRGTSCTTTAPTNRLRQKRNLEKYSTPRHATQRCLLHYVWAVISGTTRTALARPESVSKTTLSCRYWACECRRALLPKEPFHPQMTSSRVASFQQQYFFDTMADQAQRYNGAVFDGLVPASWSSAKGPSAATGRRVMNLMRPPFTGWECKRALTRAPALSGRSPIPHILPVACPALQAPPRPARPRRARLQMTLEPLLSSTVLY